MYRFLGTFMINNNWEKRCACAVLILCYTPSLFFPFIFYSLFLLLSFMLSLLLHYPTVSNVFTRKIKSARNSGAYIYSSPAIKSSLLISCSTPRTLPFVYLTLLKDIVAKEKMYILYLKFSGVSYCC